MSNKLLNTLLFFCMLCTACNNYKTKKMEEKKRFGWELAITAPKDYPIEVHNDGYLATDEKFITAITNVGVERQGWGFEGATAGGGNVIPTQLSLTWASYAEKKFWKIDTTLPADTMLALFRKGFMFTNRSGVTARVDYKGITIGLAPGGVVVLWLVADWQRTEVGRFQAKETFVDVNSFSNNSQNFTQDQFMQYYYEGFVPKESQERIKAHGIPYGLWDKYRLHYNYRFRIQFYKDDKEKPERDLSYFNGEREIFEGDQINMYREKPLPWRAEFYFDAKWAETEFNDEEIMNAEGGISRA